MHPDKIYALAEQANRRMNAGDLNGALDIAYRIRDLGPHYYVSYIVSGLLINIGNAQANEQTIREGFELLRKDFETIIHHRELAASAHYNLANGYSALSHFRRMKDRYATCFKETELDQAKLHYRKALEYEPQKPSSWLILGIVSTNLAEWLMP